MRDKLLNSLAAGGPCICTPVAAEGLYLPPPLSGQVGASAEEFSANIMQVHDDPALNVACSRAGLNLIAAPASEAKVDGLLHGVVGNFAD